jgi:hypothetical protein
VFCTHTDIIRNYLLNISCDLSPCFSYVKSEKGFYKSIAFCPPSTPGFSRRKRGDILNGLFKKWDGEEWTGFLWLGIGTGGGHL